MLTNNSGQLFIVTALAIALIISSTSLYVYELSKKSRLESTFFEGDIVFALKQATENTVISSLANVSNGGEETILATNLNKLSQVIRSLNQHGVCQLDFTLLNNSMYNSGIRLSWNMSTIGISSAYVDFKLRINAISINMTTEYAINITTMVELSGYYVKIDENQSLVNLTCKLYNEAESALMKKIAIFYEDMGNWIRVDSSNNLTITEYGDGTYTITFNVSNSQDNVKVLAQVLDLRDINVQTILTCHED